MARPRRNPPLPKLPPRKPDTHKGDYGRVLIVAGSLGMTGAAILASQAAYRSGAGLVAIATPASLVPVISSNQTCAIVHALPDTGDGAIAATARQRIAHLSRGCTSIAIGPGLGQDPQTQEEVRAIVTSGSAPLVVDADALNAFSENPNLLATGEAARILTPHPGELARLLHTSTPEVQANRPSLAQETASRLKSIVVLKGHRTIVTDGTRLWVNTTGNPGMATGGSGDVLTGVITALLGQGLAPFEAAQLGVYLHGRAGDLAARAIGMISLMATDILEALPDAFRQHHPPSNR